MDCSFKCRVCLEEGDEMFYLFSQTIIDNIELDYATIMMVCAAVQVDFEDCYPKGVCASCFENLKQAYIFKLLCEKSYQTLCNEDNKCDIIILEDCDNIAVNEDNDITDITIDNSEELRTDDDINEEDTSAADEPDYNIKKKSNVLKQYTCEWCKSVFKRIDYFKKHLKTHGVSIDMIPNYVNIKTVSCHLCYKEFQSTHGLRYHIENHKGTKNHKCPHENCNWSFISKQGLVNHQKIHTDTKSYLCSICGKSYLSRDSLAHHVKFHSGERPHKCPLCDKAYFQVCHLKKHLLVHDGIKPHTCEQCGRSYTTNSQLKKHFNKFCGVGKKPVFKFKKNEKIYEKA